MNQTRQLAAIMFTDIIDYSNLMQENDTQAKIIKEKYHQNVYTINEKYNGNVIQFYGGGTLCIYKSAIDAVHCAIELQSIFTKDPQIPVKIGIHTGDIIFNGNEVIGDSINVASRIESLAVRNSVFISGKVYDEIKNQKSIQTQYLGLHYLKNVDSPIDIYVIYNADHAQKTRDLLQQAGLYNGISNEPKNSWWSTFGRNKSFISYGLILILMLVSLLLYLLNNNTGNSEDTAVKTIAVLPFVNLTRDLEQEYFSDGITEDIITQLSKINELKVISRSSIMLYKNTKRSIKEIANDLEVVYILEGSVRKDGDSIRITTQLIDTQTDNTVWGQTFNHELKYIFEIQQDVAYEVAKALHAKLTNEEKENIRQISTRNSEAYELYLQGLYNLRAGTKEGLDKSFPLLRAAIILDPEFADAYAEIAGYYIRQGAWRGQLSPEVARQEALQYVRKALELNSELKSAHTRMGTIKFWFELDFIGAEIEYKKGGDSEVYGFYLLMMGRFEEAESMFNEVYGRDPFESHDRPHRGITQYFLGNEEEAINILKGGVSLHPNVLTGYHKLGKIYLALGKYPACIELLEQGMQISNERLPSILSDLAIAYHRTGGHDKFTELLAELNLLQAKSNKGSPSFFLAQTYAGIGEIELAFEWLNRAYKDREVELIWLKIEPQFEILHSDQRYKDLLEKVGFSMQ